MKTLAKVQGRTEQHLGYRVNEVSDSMKLAMEITTSVLKTCICQVATLNYIHVHKF